MYVKAKPNFQKYIQVLSSIDSVYIPVLGGQFLAAFPPGAPPRWWRAFAPCCGLPKIRAWCRPWRLSRRRRWGRSQRDIVKDETTMIVSTL